MIKQIIFATLITIIKGKSPLVITKVLNNSEVPVISPLKVNSGEHLTLNCKIIISDNESNSYNQVMWSKKETTLRSDIFKIVNSKEPSEITFSPIRVHDQGAYICTNIKHTLFKTVDVVVNSNSEPELLITRIINRTEKPLVPPRVMLMSGQHLTLNCKVTISNNETNDEVIWVKKEYNAQPQKMYKNTTDPYKLVFNAIKLPDRGLYVCMNSKYNISKTINVIVKPRRRKLLPVSKASNCEPVEKESDFDGDGVATKLPQNRCAFNFPEFKSDFGNSLNYTHNFHNEDVFKFGNSDIDNMYSSETTYDKYTFRNSIFAVPLTILAVLGIIRICYYFRNRYSIGWERLNHLRHLCTHQICAHRRTVDPYTGCLLEPRNPLSVLIIHRIMCGDYGNRNVIDVPPSYDDSTANSDLPPSYNDAVRNNSDSVLVPADSVQNQSSY